MKSFCVKGETRQICTIPEVVPNESYLKMIVAITERFNDTKFLCFTTKCELVDNCLDIHNSFLENLRMVFRVCGSFFSVYFFSLSMAYVRFNYRGQESVLANVLQCRKYCGD